MKVIGLMSGTSADGIDAALVELDGRGLQLDWDVLGFVNRPFPDDVRRDILGLCDVQTARVDAICRAHVALGEWFAEAALAVCEVAGVSPKDVVLIGSHGQTIHHLPEPVARFGRTVRGTLQIGDPAIIAERTGVTTVSDFRARDMAVGGQGAPLVPLVDFLMFRSPRCGRAMLNVGGIANLTILPAQCRIEDVIAFDTGPGNMVIDGVVSRLTNGAQAFDRDGGLARRGVVLPDLLEHLMADGYFAMCPPKSTGRELFGRQAVDRFVASGGAIEDLVRTAVAWTALSVADALARYALPRCEISELVVSGGGARNPAVMDALSERVAPIEVLPVENFGIRAEEKEAVAFAVLAYQTLKGQPGNAPAATGASKPVVLGSMTPGVNMGNWVDFWS